MPEKYFTVCSCSLEVNVQLMVKLLDQEALVGYVQTDEYLQDIHEVLPLLSIFHANTYLWISWQITYCFVPPASGYLLSTSFI